MPSKPPPMRNLAFGELAAADEAVNDRNMVIRGYLDFKEAAYHISTGKTWYLLGSKGAGKSSVFEHLRLKWEGSHNQFFVGLDLKNFPVADVSNIQTGQSVGSSMRIQSAWEFVLLLKLIESINRDNGKEFNSAFDNMCREFERAGLISPDLNRKVTKWASTGFDLEFNFGFLKAVVGRKERVQIMDLLAVIYDILKNVSTTSRHVVAVDGLDSFFLEADDNNGSLAGLIHAIENVNRTVHSESRRTNVIAAVRTELFENIESTDSNKLKSRCIYLDWSASGFDATNDLWALVDKKIQVDNPEVKSVVATYLSTDIGQGPYNTVPEYLLSNTRLLPRDLIALMKEVQKEHPGSAQATESAVVQAVRKYSEQYFVGEILNNLHGILKKTPDRPKIVRSFMAGLSSLDNAVFSLHGLQREIDHGVSESDTILLLEQLYEIGAIGNRIENADGYARTNFKFRRSNSITINVRRPMMLHNALIVAWNLRRSG
ncbi:P-loop ATPase, Sll1717 family [Mycetocola tolaasinivorans]|uniref:P-loop ATPase, Sll1717 family n=1 Tax=Mycetocola tolaasinivorans TaxID=76635 RepID=UPI0011C4189B|nr:hypothetical protein [Mycetocola tolaasinivorans]